MAIAIFAIANVFSSSSEYSNVLNNSRNFSASKMFWYNIQEWFHHVFMSLQLISKSPLVLPNCFLYYFSTYRIAIAIQGCSGK